MVLAKSTVEEVLAYVEPRIRIHTKSHGSTNQRHKIFVLGLSGLQGSGKSTWAKHLAVELERSHGYKVLVLSMDDLYHNHDQLINIRTSNPDNRLLRTRGQPGTHDEELAKQFFESLQNEGQVRVPAFDKSKFNGEGDRVPVEQWTVLPADETVDVLIFEGWCMGFTAIPDEEVEQKWNLSKQRRAHEPEDKQCSTTMLGTHDLAHIKIINQNLKRYNNTFMNSAFFDYMILLDADKLENVYEWRTHQEHELWKIKNTGMSDEQVIAFVQGYMPAYELYLEALQTNPFVGSSSNGAFRQLRVLMNVSRNIVGFTEM